MFKIYEREKERENMSDVNTGILSGRIAKKEIRMHGELTIANISLAVNYYDKREKKEMPVYVPVSVFGKEAEALSHYADIGDQILVQGEWRPQSWVSKSGESHYTLRLSATQVVFGRKKGDRKNELTNGSFHFHSPDEEDDDLPF